MQHLSTVVLMAALLAAPLAYAAEQTAFTTWHNRLIIPEFEPLPPRHTPRYADGTFVPPIITQDLQLTADNNPVLLAFAIYIPPHITVTIGPGTTLYAHEFAQLNVAGSLIINGAASHPVVFDTNETHPLNQVWGGVSLVAGGEAIINHARFRHATPALACLPGSRLSASAVDIEQTALGLYTESASCQLVHSRLRSFRDGIIAINVAPPNNRTTIIAKNAAIRKNHVRTLQVAPN
ncbi:MAG: hypothetical protein HY372_03765 [Candidatus Andersenbacteria bacterium]|nr:hypothetical protein [Candidatus Andersenbacteria bacterium]